MGILKKAANSDTPSMELFHKVLDIFNEGATSPNVQKSTPDTNPNEKAGEKKLAIKQSNSLSKKASIYAADEEDDSSAPMNEEQFTEMLKVNTRMIGRKARGKLAKAYLIYPDDKIKGIWEFITTV
jgi:hypothetical protein